MQALHANGITLHYQLRAGTGAVPTPIVFINSLGTDFRIWDRLVAHMPNDLTILRYDKRGHGLSEVTAPPYAITDHGDDLAGLMDALGLRDAIIIGISVGGLIAQDMAIRRPDLVRALVLCDTAARIGTTAAWNDRIAEIKQGGIDSIAETVMERWFPQSYRDRNKAELATWRAMLTRSPVDGYIGTCAALGTADLTAATRGIRKPTVCVCGTDDLSTPPHLVQELATLIPNTPFHLIENAGHLPCIDQTEQMAAILLPFIKEHSRGG